MCAPALSHDVHGNEVMPLIKKRIKKYTASIKDAARIVRV